MPRGIDPDATEFEGVRVDLSPRQLCEALRTCQIEVETGSHGNTRPFIHYQGRRWLGRTDLLDDVCTGGIADKTAEEWRLHYLKLAQWSLGGRLYAWPDGRLGLSVIDSYSDG